MSDEDDLEDFETDQDDLEREDDEKETEEWEDGLQNFSLPQSLQERTLQPKKNEDLNKDTVNVGQTQKCQDN